MKVNLFQLLVFFSSVPLFARQSDSLLQAKDKVFQLGEVTVVGTPTDSLSTLTSRKFEKFNRVDVSNSLNLLSGITLANVGPRNESVVYVRGFDLRQVPVFIDGVPVYVPYDGYVDMGRFTSVDLSQVSVSKGFASILYGANTLGGAINLVSRKPREKIEINATTGIMSGDGYRWNVNAGSNLGKFYLQLGVSQLKQDYLPMSKEFEVMTNEDGDKRENSYRDDLKFSAKAGYVPNATDEYVVGYVNQSGKKGTPPYTGTDTRIQTRFWQWPKWDKESLYFISNTALNNKLKVKTRWYYDTFVNELFSYDNATYSAMTRPFAFQSYYDDYTLGASGELESRLMTKSIMKLGVQYKRDIHRENNLNEPQRTFIDETISIGLEDTYQITSYLALVPGVSYNARNSSKAQDYNSTTKEVSDFPSNSNDAINVQLGMFWDININQGLKGTVSRKTRFATIKDRYSYRLGTAIPNPDLAAEVAVNYDLTYTGKLLEKLMLTTSVFRSDISDIIQQVDNVQPGRFQLQNSGDAVFYGYEANADYLLMKGINVGANYTYLRRSNKTNPALFFTNVPDHKLFGYIDYRFIDRATLTLSSEYDSKRYSTSYGTYAKGYLLANAKASVKIIKYLRVEGGVNNIFDRNYSLVEGFPEAGRNYFVNLVFNYQ